MDERRNNVVNIKIVVNSENNKIAKIVEDKTASLISKYNSPEVTYNVIKAKISNSFTMWYNTLFLFFDKDWVKVHTEDFAEDIQMFNHFSESSIGICYLNDFIDVVNNYPEIQEDILSFLDSMYDLFDMR